MNVIVSIKETKDLPQINKSSCFSVIFLMLLLMSYKIENFVNSYENNSICNLNSLELTQTIPFQ